MMRSGQVQEPWARDTAGQFWVFVQDILGLRWPDQRVFSPQVGRCGMFELGKQIGNPGSQRVGPDQRLERIVSTLDDLEQRAVVERTGTSEEDISDQRLPQGRRVNRDRS